MHEISLIRTVFRTLEQEFPEQINRLKKIKIKAGLLTNIQPILMENAFNAVTIEEVQFKNVELEVEITKIIVRCNACQLDSEVEHYRFLCSKCLQPSKNIVQGEELLISEVEFES